jgi:DNA-binding response OmpR family regulator
MTDPNRRGSAPSDRRRASRGGRRAGDRPGRHPAILVADPYPAARVPVARYLDRYCFEVWEAESVAEAMEIARTRRPRVVLWGFEGGEADAACGSLAANARIITLAASDSHDVARPESAVLTKPFGLRHMLDQLRIALSSSPDPA